LACVKLPRVLEWAERLRANQARAGVGLGACRLVIDRCVLNLEGFVVRN
jgi:hypothetical protein